MIPQRYITEWKTNAPWPNDAQIEQDLVIERALITLFSDPLIASQLAFRGGTALHKLFMKPQVRYSEDIDLVQIKDAPIGPVLSAIRECFKFLGTKVKHKTSERMNTIVFRFESEIQPIINLRLKIEINCREHFTVFGYQQVGHSVSNGWFSGECTLNSYILEELLATKLRALYQRKKGRDLFDLYYALLMCDVDTQKVIEAFSQYMKFSVGSSPSRKVLLQNLEQKMKSPEFKNDTYALLRPAVNYDHQIAFTRIKAELIDRL